MSDYLDLPIGEQAPDVVTAVIEIPQGSTNKYEYDKELQVFRLDRNLHSPVHYPGDYGFIPRTLAEDGDPLDILVLGDAPTFPGCMYQRDRSACLRCSIKAFGTRRFLLMPRAIRAFRPFGITPTCCPTFSAKWNTSFLSTRISKASEPR